MSEKKDILAVAKAQEIIMDFLKDYFKQEQISLVENILKTCPVNIVDEETINKKESNNDEIYDKEHIGAKASEEGLFLPESYTHYNPNEEFDEDAKLSLIIHEYAHRLRKANSQYGNMFEEGFSTIFAEACLINYKLKKQVHEGVYVNSSWKYKKAESQIIAIMYILNQKGMDIGLMGEYIFGDQNIFKQKCMQIFGKEFEKYFDLANSSKDQYYNNYDISEQNSEILLTNILKNYIAKNGLDLKKFWDKNSILLFNRNSKTLANSIVAAGEKAFKESEKKEYHLFESSTKISINDDQQEKEDRINRIRKIVNERYSIAGKNKEEIYSILENLCSDYIQKKHSGKKENLIFIEEVKKIFPNIEDFSKKFIELRRFNNSSSVFDNLQLNNISFSNIENCVSQQLDIYKQQETINRAKTLFDHCSGKEDLLSKIDELKNASSNIDFNQILPNYDDFVQFVREIQQYIPDKFPKEQNWNYQTIYSEILKLYISKKGKDLLQDKDKATEYQATFEYVAKQYKAVTNEDSFNNANELDIQLNNSLSFKQEKQEKEKNTKEIAEIAKKNLEVEKSNILKRNLIIKIFKRKQIKNLTTKISKLEQLIQNNELLIDNLASEIEELGKQIKLNDNKLVELYGIGLSDYRKIITQCKNEKLTSEHLLEKSKEIQQMMRSLNIQEKEQYLISLYEKNGLERQSLVEQVEEMKK